MVAVLALAFGPAGSVRADLLDEEEPVTKPEPQPQPPPAPVPSPEGEPQSGAESAPPKPAKGPTPHAKSTSGTSTTTVIPPKEGGKNGKKTAKPKKEEPVHFDSKGLKGLRDKGMVELMQDVVVTQGDMRMEADHAQVFFDEGAKDKKDRGLIKVIADGNPVKIYGIDEHSGDRFRAFGNQAVFLNKERTVVLEGNARLWRGDDSVVRSKKITYEMNTGWIRADKVAGEVVPNDKPTGASTGAGTSTSPSDGSSAAPATPASSSPPPPASDAAVAPPASPEP